MTSTLLQVSTGLRPIVIGAMPILMKFGRINHKQLLVNLPSCPPRVISTPWLPDQWKLRQAARIAALQDTAITRRTVVHLSLTESLRYLHYWCQISESIDRCFRCSVTRWKRIAL
jgi:hypothetical protein